MIDLLLDYWGWFLAGYLFFIAAVLAFFAGAGRLDDERPRHWTERDGE